MLLACANTPIHNDGLHGFSWCLLQGALPPVWTRPQGTRHIIVSNLARLKTQSTQIKAVTANEAVAKSKPTLLVVYKISYSFGLFAVFRYFNRLRKRKTFPSKIYVVSWCVSLICLSLTCASCSFFASNQTQFDKQKYLFKFTNECVQKQHKTVASLGATLPTNYKTCLVFFLKQRVCDSNIQVTMGYISTHWVWQCLLFHSNNFSNRSCEHQNRSE